jgi:hypothetical protein
MIPETDLSMQAAGIPGKGASIVPAAHKWGEVKLSLAHYNRFVVIFTADRFLL